MEIYIIYITPQAERLEIEKVKIQQIGRVYDLYNHGDTIKKPKKCYLL
jgi:hypothetical protein